MTLHHGDCLDVMAAMDPESVDAIVTDPPYGLGFMGKAWDDAKRLASVPPSAIALAATGRDPYPKTGKGPAAVAFDGRAFQGWCERWAEAAYRVAKPSSYLLAFGGTRTVHRMTCAIEDAGWIIRDMLVWAYASGFPKSKASLKPAWEPIVMARKPGPLRMLAIDECRIPFVGETPDDRDGEATEHTRYTLDGGTNLAAKPGRRIKSDRASAVPGGRTTSKPGGGIGARPDAGLNNERVGFDWRQREGRWPANVILTDDLFSGDTPGVIGGGWQSGGGNPPRRLSDSDGVTLGTGWPLGETGKLPVDTEGTYSRFFLIPKADRTDREPVLGGPMAEHRTLSGGVSVAEGRTAVRGRPGLRANHHPTVKPVDLMRHLVRLVTPTGGIVLDPFLGSGTTALAAEMEGFEWIGIEKEAEYVAIAEARLNGTQRGMAL